MNPIKEIRFALIINRTINRIKDIPMKLSVNALIQIIALAGQGLNQVGQLGLGPKANTYVSIGLTTAQALTAILAHFATPPGTIPPTTTKLTK